MFAILHINQKGIEILHFKKYKKISQEKIIDCKTVLEHKMCLLRK